MVSDTHPQRATRGFITLLYVAVCTIAAIYAPQPLLSAIQGVYPHYSDTTIALLMTVTLAPLGIAPLIYGFFLSSLDTRHVLQACVTILALASAGLWLAQSFAALLFFRLVQGLVIPAMLTCIMAHISAKFQGTQLQRALAVYIGLTILGGLLGRTLSGFAASLWGWRAIFVMLACALAFALVLLWKLESKPQGHFSPVRAAEFRAILRTPGVTRLLCVDGFGFFVFTAIASYLPFYLAQGGAGLSEWRISLMYLGYGIGVFMAFASRRISAFLGCEMRAIALGILIYFIALAGFFSTSTTVIFLAMCLVCTGQFLEHSISPGLINRIAQADKGAVNGLYLSVYYSSGALGSYLPGFIYQHYGWNIFIISLACVLLLALAATRGVQKHVPAK